MLLDKSGEVVAGEHAGVVAAIAIAFMYLAFRNSVFWFVLDVLVVTVTTAAVATNQTLLHLVALLLCVAILNKEHEDILFGITVIALSVFGDNIADTRPKADAIHQFSVSVGWLHFHVRFSRGTP